MASVVWAAVAVVMVTTLDGGCESRPSNYHPLHQLKQEKLILKQLAKIDQLLLKAISVNNCTHLSMKPALHPTTGETGAEQNMTGEELKKGSEEGKKPGANKGKKGEEEGEKPGSEEGEKEPEHVECAYDKLSPNHTMLLPPNTDCKAHKTGITAEEKEEILKVHNDFRAKVALGEELRGDPGPQPPAANMRQLVWNEELAEVAQAWASQCPSKHDPSRNRKICSKKYRVGQNIHYYWGVDEEPDWTKAATHWYDEVADVPANLSKSFKLLSDKKIGHYTQMVWATTREIGCGLVYYETEKEGVKYTQSKIYVCNYGPAGNVWQRPFYQHGPSVSMCPEGGGVSELYPNLCL